MSKKTLVTGATGFLGQNLVPRLADRYDLVALVRSQSLQSKAAIALQDEGVQIVTGDVVDTEAVQNAANGAELIIHMAALVPSMQHNPWSDRQIFDVNVGATKNLLKVMDQVGCKDFIFISSMAVYGKNLIATGIPCTEETPVKKLGHTYADSKLAAEKAIMESAQNIRWTIFRPAIILGSGEQSFVSGLAPNLTRGRVPLVNKGMVHWSVIGVNDIASAVIQSIEDRERMGRQVYNVVTEDVRFADLMSFVAQEIGAKSPSMNLPRLSLVMMSNIMQAVPLRKVREPALNLLPIANGMRISGTKLRDTGWEPHQKWPDILRESCDSWKTISSNTT